MKKKTILFLSVLFLSLLLSAAVTKRQQSGAQILAACLERSRAKDRRQLSLMMGVSEGRPVMEEKEEASRQAGRFTMEFADGKWKNEDDKGSLSGGELFYRDGKIVIRLEEGYYLKQAKKDSIEEELYVEQEGKEAIIDCGQLGTEKITVWLALDAANPSITAPGYSYDGSFTKEKVVIPVEVADEGSGVAAVFYAREEEDGGERKEWAVEPDENGNFRFDIVVDESFRGVYEVRAEDGCGNEAKIEFPVKVDRDAPVIRSMKKSPEQEFFNGQIEIEIEADDRGGSGIRKIFYNTAMQLEGSMEADGDCGRYQIQVPDKEFVGKYYIWAEDFLGNCKKEPSIIEIKIDKTPPQIGEIKTNLNKNMFGKKEVEITVEAFDHIGMEQKENGEKGRGPEVFLSFTEDGSGRVKLARTGYNEKNGNSIYRFITDKWECSGQKLYIWAEDAAGNRSGFSNAVVNIDRTAPVISDISFEAGEEGLDKDKMINRFSFGTFSNGQIRVKVTASDNQNGAGIRNIALYYKLPKHADKWELLTEPNYFESVKGDEPVTAEFVLTKEILDAICGKDSSLSLEDAIYARAEDNAYAENENGVAIFNTGNISAPVGLGTVILEQDDPRIFLETVNKPDAEVVWQGRKYACFGKDTDIVMEAGDDTGSSNWSGIWKWKVTVNNAVVAEDSYEEARRTKPGRIVVNTGKFADINGKPVAADREGFFHMKAEAKDYAGNDRQVLLDFCMDYEAPVIGSLTKTPDGKWSADKVTVQVSNVTDLAAPFSSQVKEVRYSTKNKIESSGCAVKINDANYQFQVTGECEDTYYIWAIDGAGHVSPYKTIKVNIDKTPPEITGFSFRAKGFREAAGDSLESTAGMKSYGFYFKEDVTVIVKANDQFRDKKKKNRPSSGVKYVEYYTVDKNGKKLTEGKKEADKRNEISFLIPANFKGQIYAKATDYALNAPGKPGGAVHKPDGYAHPDGSVAESEKIHNKTAILRLNRVTSDKKDAGQKDLFCENVAVEMIASDSFSGIRKIQWKVTSQYDREKNQQGTLLIDNQGKLTGDADGWEITGKEKNLVTMVKKTIQVSNNSNDIKLWIKLTDRAGNVTQRKDSFSIDKTPPKIKVEYDNLSHNHSLLDGKNYYKAGRNAVITITERNFSASGTVGEIHNTYGDVPAIGKWDRHYDEKNPDRTTYTAHISYRADGDYTFHIACTDLAGNRAAKFKTDRFVVDLTAPSIKVSYDNNSPKNGKYYNKPRIATISVIEKNFEPGQVKIKGKAKKSGKEISFPAMSGWSSQGDSHTAAITYLEDADYTFDISCTDKAGNQEEGYRTDRFTVDKTKPKLIISGIKNHSANRGEVRPVISWSDHNLQDDASIFLTAYSQKGKLPYKGIYSKIADGRQFVFDDFEYTKEKDDIYTIEAMAKDKAGNEEKQVIRFSVNRFGSVYIFSGEAEEIAGTYVKEEKDISITEINVDRIDIEGVEVRAVKDGSANMLVPGKDFSVKKEEGDGSWCRYMYILFAHNFSEEGQYAIHISSKDRAGNINETADEGKEARLSFGIDKTPPVILPVNLESAASYAEDGKDVIVDITDNVFLETAEFYLNGEKIKVKKDDRGYFFHIPQSSKKQSLEIIASDGAGNRAKREVKEFYITTSRLVRWYTNRVAFIGTIAVAAALLIYLSLSFVLKKVKKMV